MRADDLRFIVHCLRQGHCPALVGPSNTGKSILLQSLLTEEVRRHCTPEGAQPPVIVFADVLPAEPTEQVFHGLLLGSIVEGLEGVDGAENALRTIKTLYEKALHSTNLGARSLFASGVRELGRADDIRLVLILDEFDDVFRALSPWPFRQLRALHDRLGDRLLYVVSTSRRLERLRSGPDTYEFRELFHPYTRVLRPLDRTDAERFVAYLAEGRGHDLDQERVSLVIELSGGHPGLLERVYGLLSKGRPAADTLQDVVAQLSERRPIQKECRRLWDELEEEEQEGLLALVREDEPALEAEQRRGVETKGLVVEREDDGLTIFSPVFAAFVRAELGRRLRAGRGLWYDAKTRQVWRDNEDLTRELSADQYALVVFLCQHPGTICTKDEIARAVWPELSEEGVTDAQIYQLVSRVREKVEPDPKKPRYIVTVRGQGYRLEVPS